VAIKLTFLVLIYNCLLWVCAVEESGMPASCSGADSSTVDTVWSGCKCLTSDRSTHYLFTAGKTTITAFSCTWTELNSRSHHVYSNWTAYNGVHNLAVHTMVWFSVGSYVHIDVLQFMNTSMNTPIGIYMFRIGVHFVSTCAVNKAKCFNHAQLLLPWVSRPFT